MQEFLRKFAYLNFWMAIAAGMLCYQTYFIFNLTTDYFYIGFSFFSTLFIYNFQRLIKNYRMGDHILTDRHFWIRVHQGNIVALLWISFFLVLLCALFLGMKTILFVLIAGVISFAYTGISKKRSKGLREFPGIKIVLVSSVWTVVTILIPLIEAGQLSSEIVPFLIQQFIFLFILCLPFDIRDVEVDEKKIKTIPQLIGKINSIFLCELLLGILFFYVYHSSQNTSFIISSGVIFLYSGIVIWLVRKKKSELFYLYLIDGALILQVLLNYLAINFP